MKTTPKQAEHFARNGWCLFEHDPTLLEWVNRTLPAAREALSAPENRVWFRHAGTWFAGVNVLNNDAHGRVAGGINLQGEATDFLRSELHADLTRMDQAQLSVCFEGYPKADRDESAAAHGYRARRDAAHLDGLLKEGLTPQSVDHQRYAREYHDYILAIPMVAVPIHASPFVVWSGSHKLVRETFLKYLEPYAPQDWRNVPLTDCYSALRKRIFAECERVELPVQPGQAILGHRLLLHGTGAWKDGVSLRGENSELGRMICFFRPASLSIEQWLGEA